MCSDLCPCPSESQFDSSLWPDNFFTTPRANGDRLNLTGSYTSLETCIDDILKSNSRSSTDTIRKTLKLIPLDTLAIINDGTYPTVAELKNGLSIDDAPANKLKLLLKEAVIGMLSSIYNILDNNFECSALCTPSYFALGSDNIATTAPPSRGCVRIF
jgi:hypothetical protein